MNLTSLLPVVAMISFGWCLLPAVGQLPTMITQPDRQPAVRVVSLPPPPGYSRNHSSQVSTGAHVPLKPTNPTIIPNSANSSSVVGNVGGGVAYQT